MAAQERHGWTYSLFAGVVALPIAIWFSWPSHQPLRLSWGTVIMIVAAMVAARIGGWLAMLAGGRDYGWRAAFFTGLLYLVFMGVLGVVLNHLLYLSQSALFHTAPAEIARLDPWASHLQQGVLVFAWWFFEQCLGTIFFISMMLAWWTILPACVLGTLAFHWLLRMRQGKPANAG